MIGGKWWLSQCVCYAGAGVDRARVGEGIRGGGGAVVVAVGGRQTEMVFRGRCQQQQERQKTSMEQWVDKVDGSLGGCWRVQYRVHLGADVESCISTIVSNAGSTIARLCL